MRSNFSIHRLIPGDIDLFRQLNSMFGAAFGDAATYDDEPPSDDYLEQLLIKDHVIPLVALSGGQVVGGLVAYELDKFERARKEIYIYDLAVAEAHRRRGLATALIEKLREIAAKRSAWVIYVQADYGDDPAVALYAKLGTKEEVMHFDIEIGTVSVPKYR